MIGPGHSLSSSGSVFNQSPGSWMKGLALQVLSPAMYTVTGCLYHYKLFTGTLFIPLKMTMPDDWNPLSCCRDSLPTDRSLSN